MTDSDKKVDPLDAIVEAQRQPKELRRLPRLIGRSVRLVRHAGPGLFAASTTIQLLHGLLLAAQVLLVGAVLDAILLVEETNVSWEPVILPVAGLALAMGLNSVAGAVQGQQQRLLGELVIRQTWMSVLDVSTSVSLIEFEEPGFYDRLQRVQSNAVSQPFVMTQGLIGIVGGLAGLAGLVASVFVLSPLVLPLLMVAALPLYVGTRILSKREFNFIVEQVPRVRMRDYIRSLQVGSRPAKEVRAFGLTEALRARFDRVYLDYIAALKQHIRRRTTISLSTNVMSALVIARNVALPGVARCEWRPRHRRRRRCHSRRSNDRRAAFRLVRWRAADLRVEPLPRRPGGIPRDETGYGRSRHGRRPSTARICHARRGRAHVLVPGDRPSGRSPGFPQRELW